MTEGMGTIDLQNRCPASGVGSISMRFRQPALRRRLSHHPHVVDERPAHVPSFSRLSNEIAVDELEAVKLTEAECQTLVPSRYPSARGSAETTVEALPALRPQGLRPK